MDLLSNYTFGEYVNIFANEKDFPDVYVICNEPNAVCFMYDDEELTILRFIVSKLIKAKNFNEEDYVRAIEPLDLPSLKYGFRIIILPKSKQAEMSLNEYQSQASRTIPNTENANAMRAHALFGLCSEVGELHGLYQKINQGHPFDKDHAKKELGDVLWMIAEYATCMGWTLEDVAKTNIEKLWKRYPDGFDVKKSLNRKEGDV